MMKWEICCILNFHRNFTCKNPTDWYINCAIFGAKIHFPVIYVSHSIYLANPALKSYYSNYVIRFTVRNPARLNCRFSQDLCHDVVIRYDTDRMQTHCLHTLKISNSSSSQWIHSVSDTVHFGKLQKRIRHGNIYSIKKT